MITSPSDLSGDDYRELEFHISKALDIVGLDHNFTDGILDAFEDAVSIAGENAVEPKSCAEDDAR